VDIADGQLSLTQKNKNFYFFIRVSNPSCFRALTHSEQTPRIPLNHPRRKCRRQASLPQLEQFLPSSSPNCTPHREQVKETIENAPVNISLFNFALPPPT